MKKALKIVALTLGGVLVFLLLVVLFTQTQIFRDRLRAVALSTLDSMLVADVQLGNLRGNLLTGFSLDHVSVKVDEDFLFAAERLDIRYNLFEIPGRKIPIDQLTIVRPTVNLLRSRDGLWNFERMIRKRADEPDTVESGPFDWSIIINQLQIQEGTVSLVDSLALADDEHREYDPYFVEYHHVILQQFNLTTSLSYAAREKRATIASLSFLSDMPDVRLEQLSGAFLVTDDFAEVQNLSIQTARSRVRLTASMADVDLLGGMELSHLQSTPISLSLRAQDLDLDELKRFLPQIDFLHGEVAADLDAGGLFGDVDVKTLYLKKGETQLYVAGSVVNLHTPENLFLRAKVTESRISSEDLRELMPTFGLPDYRSLGLTTLNLEYEGKPHDFQTKFLLETAAGDVRSNMRLKIEDPHTLRYAGEIHTRRLDLARVLEDPTLASRLNASLRIEGRGLSLEHLLASARITVDSSVLLGQPLVNSEIVVDIRQRTLSGSATLALGRMRTSLTGRLHDPPESPAAFTVEATIASLNLQELLRDTSFASDITVNMTAAGSGLTWKDLNAEFLLSFSPSQYREYRISSGDVRLTVDQQDPMNKLIALESDIADFSLKGAFDLNRLVQLVEFQLLNLRAAVAQKFVSIDSSMVTLVDRRELARLGAELSDAGVTVDAEYFLRLKDLEPISIVTGNRIFDGVGVLSGALQGDYTNLTLTGDFALESFFYGNVDAGVLVQNGAATFELKDLKPVQPLKDLDARLVASARSMHINREELDSVRVSFEYQHEYSSYTARARFNKDLGVVLAGLADVSEDQVIFTLNNLQVAFKDFAWQAEGGASVGFTSHSVTIRDLVMRKDTETVTITGTVDTDGSLSAVLAGDDLDLDGLRYLLSPDEHDRRRVAFEGRSDVKFTASGTVSDPVFEGSLRARNVGYRTVPFGNVRGEFSYRDLRLLVDVYVGRDAGQGRQQELRISGTLPIDLALTDVDQRLPDTPMDLQIRSDGVQMNILDPLLPTFDQLAGILTCDVKVLGTPRKPDYRGSISIQDCSFLFVPNNIPYTFEGTFEPEGERIKVIRAAVRNVAADRMYTRGEGALELSGDFTLREFKPGDFNLSATGKLLVVKEQTRKSALSVYGTLFVEIRSGGKLHFTGSIDQSLLSGEILVRNSTLIFPPTQASVGQQLATTIPLVFIDDTSRVVPAGERSAVDRYFGQQSDTVRIVRNGLPTKSFLDGLRYDLDIEAIGGSTEIQMIFDNTTKERLVANVEGRFFVTEDGKRWVGDLKVTRAYYYFLKQFNAEGTILYTGDFLNPELDIEATYQGTRVRSVTDTLSVPERPEKIVVKLDITGTRKEPKLVMSMTIDDVDYYSYNGITSADVQNDAVAFILTGTFPLSRAEANDVASDLRGTLGSSIVNTAAPLLTKELNDWLRTQTRIINSVELSYEGQGAFGESASIRVSGTVFDGLWRYGGRVSDPLNPNFSLLYSVGDILNRESLRNLMIEYERRVELGTLGGQTNDLRGVNSARIFYRFSFNRFWF